MRMAPGPALRSLLLAPPAAGVDGITLHARVPFWDEAALPFRLEGGGTVVRLVPDAGFPKRALAATPDELAVVADCPDAPGWLVPESVVADWMARHVECAPLEDALASHPAYAYLTAPDEEGRSRVGRGRLVHWTPGIPTVAHLRGPEFLPDDEEAPDVNRERRAYAEAVEDLLRHLGAAFDLDGLEVAVRLDVPEQDGRRGEAGDARAAAPSDPFVS